MDERVLGQYRLVALLGSDAFSESYLARRLKHGTREAWAVVRCVRASPENDEAQMFFFEDLELAASITHPNVAEVLEVTTDELWFAREYLHGDPLTEILEADAFDPERTAISVACRMIADAADGVHAGHELRGKENARLEIVHRALSPDTIIVTYEGITKVVDFGIARLRNALGGAPSSSGRGLAYLSPEQARADGAIDRRTDVFALGVLLWELTTGRRRLRAEEPDALAVVLERGVPAPRTIVRDYPADLEDVVMKAVARDRRERFSTAEELSAALQPFACPALDEVGARVRALLKDRMRDREKLLRAFADA